MFLAILYFSDSIKYLFDMFLMSNLHFNFEEKHSTYEILTSNSSKTEKKLIWIFQLLHFQLYRFKVTITDHMCFKCNLLVEFYFKLTEKFQQVIENVKEVATRNLWKGKIIDTN